MPLSLLSSISSLSISLSLSSLYLSLSFSLCLSLSPLFSLSPLSLSLSLLAHRPPLYSLYCCNKQPRKPHQLAYIHPGINYGYFPQVVFCAHFIFSSNVAHLLRSKSACQSKGTLLTFTFIPLAGHFCPKRLTIEQYNKRYIIKRQTDTGNACNTNF